MKAGYKQSRACHLLSCMAYTSTLKMEAICSSESSVDFQRTTRRYITEYRTLRHHHCENLKSNILFCLVALDMEDAFEPITAVCKCGQIRMLNLK
jgi:hypothetical protein